MLDFIEKILKEGMLPPTPDAGNKIKQIIKVTDNDTVSEFGLLVKNWFSGYFMGGKNNDKMPELISCFKFLQKIYGTPKEQKLYRSLHLRIPSTNKNIKLQGNNKINTGPTPVQSYSSTKQGALFYYTRFAVKENNEIESYPDRAWILIEVNSGNDIETLITAEKLVQFLSDWYQSILENISKFELDAKLVKRVASAYNSIDMRKQDEVICYVKNSSINANIIEVMNPPKQ